MSHGACQVLKDEFSHIDRTQSGLFCHQLVSAVDGESPHLVVSRILIGLVDSLRRGAFPATRPYDTRPGRLTHSLLVGGYANRSLAHTHERFEASEIHPICGR
jgi:hypothetical protein